MASSGGNVFKKKLLILYAIFARVEYFELGPPINSMVLFGWLPCQNRLVLSFKLYTLSLTITLKQMEMTAISPPFLPFLLNREVEQELYLNKGNSFS